MDYQEAKARFEAADKRLRAQYVWGLWRRPLAEQEAALKANGALLEAYDAAEAEMRALEPPAVRAAREVEAAEARHRRMAQSW